MGGVIIIGRVVQVLVVLVVIVVNTQYYRRDNRHQQKHPFVNWIMINKRNYVYSRIYIVVLNMEKVVNGQVSKPWGQVYGVILESETINILLVWSIVMPVKEIRQQLTPSLGETGPTPVLYHIPNLNVKKIMKSPLWGTLNYVFGTKQSPLRGRNRSVCPMTMIDFVLGEENQRYVLLKIKMDIVMEQGTSDKHFIGSHCYNNGFNI